MRWEDERYVRVYTRNTGEWLALDWEARALFLFLLRVADRAGLVPTGKAGIRGLAGLAGMPLDVVERAAPMLLEDGCLRAADGGYIIPNFMAAQEARASDAQRKRDQRERDRDKAIASGASGSRAGLDAEASTVRSRSQPSVTPSGHAMTSHAVTDSHNGKVTPSLAVPICAEPSLPASQVASALAAPPLAAGQAPLFGQPPAEKPKAPRPPTAVQAWAKKAADGRRAVIPPTAVQEPKLNDGHWARLGEALKTHGQLTLDAAWALFLADDFARGKDFPPGLFIGQVDRWISDVHAAAARARSGTTGASETRPQRPAWALEREEREAAEEAKRRAEDEQIDRSFGLGGT